MDPPPSIWQQPCPISEMNLWHDWDLSGSMFESLRYYLFQYHTIPQWNFLLCGGKPELADPVVWAFTWPSIFAYLLPLNWETIFLWIFMATLGFIGMYRLLKLWYDSNWAASTGAFIFVFNGYFGSHFNQGHEGFAIFYFIPYILYFYHKTFINDQQKKPILKYWLLSLVFSWLFFTAGLPHGVFHFYPAAVLYMGLLLLKNLSKKTFWPTIFSFLRSMFSHLLALWLAAYRIWPVISWQKLLPRKNDQIEYYEFLDIVKNILRPVDNYDVWVTYFPRQFWWYWEYNSYLGPIVLFFACFSVITFILALFYKKNIGFLKPLKSGACFAIVLIIVGFLLALGNGNPWSPNYYLNRLAFYKSLHVFTRYQILIIFGICILVTKLISEIDLKSIRLKYCKCLIYMVLILLLCLLPAVNSFQLIKNIYGDPISYIRQKYGISVPPSIPRFINKDLDEQTTLLKSGYWVANCYEPLVIKLPPINLREIGRISAISDPEPAAISQITTDSILIDYNGTKKENIVLSLPRPPKLITNAPVTLLSDGRIYVKKSDIPDGRLFLQADFPENRMGLSLSLSGVPILIIFWFFVLRKSSK